MCGEIQTIELSKFGFVIDQAIYGLSIFNYSKSPNKFPTGPYTNHQCLYL